MGFSPFVPTSNFSGVSSQTGGKATPTVVHQAIATIPTPASGTYEVTVLAYIDGTTTAADEDNMELSWNGGSQIVNMICPAGASAIPVLNGPYVIDGVNGLNSLIVRTSSTVPSGTAVYHALVVITPVSVS